MQLDPQEKSHVWWQGTLKGAFKGMLIGLVIGVTTAVILGAVVSVAPAFAPIFGSFLSMSGAPLAIFNGALGLVAGAFGGGAAAVNAYHDKKHRDMDEAKIAVLEGRSQVIEQTISQSPRVKSIVSQGSRSQASFAKAELQRAQNAPSSQTLQ